MGDRILVRGKASDDGKTIAGRVVYCGMKQSDLVARQEAGSAGLAEARARRTGERGGSGGRNDHDLRPGRRHQEIVDSHHHGHRHPALCS